MDRRLTTVLAADLVEYSRLMAADEESVITRLRAFRDGIAVPRIAEAGGRLFKTTGDGFLAEFSSPVAALRCALAIQEGLAAAETGPEDQRLRLRIGLNLGDVVPDGDDLLGDGVNIAARLEGLASPGGICISRSVHDQVHGKIDVALEAMGPQTVKNLPRPVEAWRIGGGAVRPAASARRPSIAVLAFDNMSAEPNQEFLSDGLAEDIITDLSRFRWLTVIARNSTFAFKGSKKDVREIGKALGAWYVLEGSVRRAGQRIRVTGQLIEAETGTHIWAERYDRVIEDLFDLQDELTKAIVTAVEPELGLSERTRARRQTTGSLTAWEFYQRAQTIYLAAHGERMDEAIGLLDAAIATDPDFSLAYSARARSIVMMVILGNPDDRASLLREGVATARKALELDARSDDAYRSMGHVLTISERFDEALDMLDRGIELNPNHAALYMNRAQTLVGLRQYDRALEDAALAIRLSPYDPLLWIFRFVRGLAFAMRGGAGDLDQAIAEMSDAGASSMAGWPTLLMLALLHDRAGNAEASREYALKVRRNAPDLTAERALASLPLKSRMAEFIGDVEKLRALLATSE